jgi:hypothetical protein
MKLTYHTYTFLIRTRDSGRWIHVVACDKDAAVADIRQGYGEDTEIIQWSRR